MSLLATLLSSRARAGVFRALFGLDAAEVHVRELARRVEMNEATLRQELRKLKGHDLVVERRDGNRVYYSANRAHPLFPEIHRLVLKTAGLVDVLRAALGEAEVEVAFVFGSVAQGTAHAASDVDLMVIGRLGLRKLSGLLAPVATELGREVNPHAMTAAEYRRRHDAGDHFVTSVLDGPKLFVIGAADDLARLAGQRLADRAPRDP